MKKETLMSKDYLDPKICNVVEKWYLNMPMIFQNTSGLDLEEIVADYEVDYYEGNVIEEMKLTDIEIYSIVKNWYDDLISNDRSRIFNEEDIELNDYCTYCIVHLKINGHKI